MGSWDVNRSLSFWSEREFKTIMRDHNLQHKIETMLSQRESRSQLSLVHKNEFGENFKKFLNGVGSVALPYPVIAKNIQFWIQHLSWTYCQNCKLLRTERMLPNYFKRPSVKFAKNCTCTNKVYINPSVEKFPNILKGLSHDEIIVLRPFNIHLGDYVKKQNGYRQKTNLFRLTWSKQSVLENIYSLDDAESKSRCISAYEFLMSHEESAYAKFMNLRETSFKESNRFNVYNFSQNVPKQFSALVETKRKSAAIFKEKSSATAMKTYILSTYEDEDDMASSTMSKAASESVTKAFEDSSSDDNDQSTPIITKRKERKRKQATVEPDVEEEAPTTSGQKKEKSNKKLKKFTS